ncbi:MAG: hypothetical protein ACI9BW_003074 [Gammaproteobacteria bacterium]|jgi:hypothetical protein
MKSPSFLQGVLVALVLALLALFVFATFSWSLNIDELLKLTIGVVAACYVGYLLSASRQKTGRLTVCAIWTMSTIAIAFFVHGLGLYLVAHMLMIWLLRSLYFYASVLLAVVDIGLTSISAIAAVGTLTHTHNIFLTVWMFFLGQALFVAIPPIVNSRTQTGIERPPQRFHVAYRSAQAATRRIHAHTD